MTPLLSLYPELGLVCTQIQRFIEYTPRKCFNRFVQSAVYARRQRDEKPNSSVVAETMTLLANSSYGYQNIDRSQHTKTKYLSDGKTHAVLKSKFFRSFILWIIPCMKLNLPKHRLKLPKPLIAILQNAKLRMLELYYNFFTKFCDVSKFEDLEMGIFAVPCRKRTGRSYQTLNESSCRERTGRSYQTSNESKKGEIAIDWICWWFHCWWCSKLFPPNKFCETEATW